MSDRGIHPDLLEEETPSPPVEAPPRTRSSRARRETPAEPTEPTAAPAEETVEDGAEPEWWAQARSAKDPSEAFKLLAKNLPRDQLERDEVISGMVGSRADLRARELLRQQEREAAEQAKREAAERGDLYTLGEMAQRELAERDQQQRQAADGNFMDGVVLFQQRQPEDLQRKVAGQAFGVGKGQAAGVDEYLSFIVEERIKLEREALEREYRERESALRKSVLTEVNGDEPVPEREGGTPGRVREVTDEQIEAMTMQEYEALFDENGKPKPGVRHRATRGIPLNQR